MFISFKLQRRVADVEGENAIAHTATKELGGGTQTTCLFPGKNIFTFLSLRDVVNRGGPRTLLADGGQMMLLGKVEASSSDHPARFSSHHVFRQLELSCVLEMPRQLERGM